MTGWEPSKESMRAVEQAYFASHGIYKSVQPNSRRLAFVKALVESGELVSRDSLGEVTFHGVRMLDWRDRAFAAEAKLKAARAVVEAARKYENWYSSRTSERYERLNERIGKGFLFQSLQQALDNYAATRTATEEE